MQRSSIEVVLNVFINFPVEESLDNFSTPVNGFNSQKLLLNQ